MTGIRLAGEDDLLVAHVWERMVEVFGWPQSFATSGS